PRIGIVGSAFLNGDSHFSKFAHCARLGRFESNDSEANNDSESTPDLGLGKMLEKLRALLVESGFSQHTFSYRCCCSGPLRSCMPSKSSLTRPMFDQLCKPCFFE